MDLQSHRDFLIELEELVEQLFSAISELRRSDDSAPQRRELLGQIFRHVHSIKGIALTAGLARVSELAHQTENLLENARAGRVTIEDRFTDTLEEAAYAISESLSAAIVGADAKPPSELIQSFHDFRLPSADQADMPLPELPDDFKRALNETESHLLSEAVRDNESLYLLEARFGVASFDKEFQQLRTAVTRYGTVICSLPRADIEQPEEVSFTILASSQLALNALALELSTLPQVSVTALDAAPQSQSSPRLEENRNVQPQPENAPASVRIQIEELDRLISSAHELFGQTVAALDLVSHSLSADTAVELRNLDAQIRESLTSLEHKIIRLRMVSVDRVIQRAIRAGRVAAKVRGKEIQFMTAGEQLRIDKTACDAVADPLLHLVRNAVDQGIEPPTERTGLGKPAAGLIRIEAHNDGGRIRFVVGDDGRGIDPTLISAAAVKLGLFPEGTVLDTEKSLRLIFRPGFSTVAEVSTVSGRGVGLDIVEKAVERAGGNVRVRTKVGAGTEFEIRLPAALGVMRAMVVHCGPYRYCFEARLVTQRCHLVEGSSVDWQEEKLPVLALHKLLQQSGVNSEKSAEVLICQIGNNEGAAHQAIAVDGIDGLQEVLVRSLGRHSAMWPGVVGATELWNGTVGLVLDLPLLLASGRYRP